MAYRPVQVSTSVGMLELNPNEDISKFEVYGSDMQIVSICLQPGETVLSSAGSMTYTDPAIKPGVTCGNCCARCISGESCCATTWTNNAAGERFIGLSANVPGKLIPLDLNKASYRCKNGAFHSSLGDVKVSFDCDCCTLTCCFGGQGCVRQSVGGSGTAFLEAMGTIMTKEVAAGEVVVVDTFSLVAWDKNMPLDIKRASNTFCGCCCGGEGLFNTTHTGPGKVYFQSMDREKFRCAMERFINAEGAGGSLLGGVGAPESVEISR